MARPLRQPSTGGLRETGDRGAAHKYGPEPWAVYFCLVGQATAPGWANWFAPLLARELVDNHGQHTWQFLRAQKIDLSGRKSWRQSTDPIVTQQHGGTIT